MAHSVVFVTGVTGALGSWIAERAVANGMSVRALARSTAEWTARERVDASLAVVADQPISSQVEVIEGDILDAQIDPGSCDLIIHCAACTSFQDRAADASRETNVEGLRRMLQLATRLRVPFVHVSTAYVCGNREGVVLESERDLGQSFNNVYEQTKCEGEALVREWAAQTGLRAIVLRPSIVLGDSTRGHAVRFNTLYHLMRALDSIGLASTRQQLRLLGRSEVTKNIIPVDYFADIAWRIIRHAESGTYHIVHPHPITLGSLSTIFNELFDIDLQLVADERLDRVRGAPIERACGRVMVPYRPYMLNDEPRFDLRATMGALGAVAAPPQLNTAYFRRLLGYARRVNWGREVIASSADAGAIDPVREYFEIFLADRIDQNLLPDLRRLSARFTIAMKDQPGACWLLEIQEGALKSVSRHCGPSDCSFSLHSKTFLEIAAGQLPPQRAFFAGRVRIAGNMEMGLKVATVLAKFFTEYPFVAEPV